MLHEWLLDALLRDLDMVAACTAKNRPDVVASVDRAWKRAEALVDWFLKAKS